MTEKKSEFPSLVEQGKNLAKSIKNIAKDAIEGNSIFVPENIKKKRLGICKKCEFLYKSVIDESKNRCTLCGCFVAAKTGFSVEQCPAKKWKQYQNK